MTHNSSLLLAPFILAFLLFIYRFYNRERAASVLNLSFLLAIGTMLMAGLYLILGVSGNLPSYGPIGFTGIGLVLLVTAIIRMFLI